MRNKIFLGHSVRFEPLPLSRPGIVVSESNGVDWCDDNWPTDSWP
jgi:hypothetical protein